MPTLSLSKWTHQIFNHYRSVSKLLRMVPITRTSSSGIENRFVKVRSLISVKPKIVRTDNFPQFCDKFLLKSHSVMGVKISSLPRPTRNIMDRLRSSKELYSTQPDLEYWGVCADVLTYGYNAQTQTTNGYIYLWK